MSEEWDEKTERRSNPYMYQERNGLEKHIQTGIGIVVIGLIAWVGLTLTTPGTTLATLTERVTNLQTQFQQLSLELNSSAADRYTKSMADLHWQTQKLIDNRQDEQIRELKQVKETQVIYRSLKEKGD
jgi:hypothetical protein